jgi:hypothetical protein
MAEADVCAVGAELDPRGQHDAGLRDRVDPLRATAVEPSIVALHDAVAVVWIVDAEREVREEIELVARHPADDLDPIGRAEGSARKIG